VDIFDFTTQLEHNIYTDRIKYRKKKTKEDTVMGSFSARNFVELEKELRSSVNPSIAEHWDRKIKNGIVPTETLLKSPSGVDRNYHAREVKRLIRFKLDMFARVLGFLRQNWGIQELHGKQLHYIGIGTAQAFKQIVSVANNNRLEVWGYDISKVSCNKGRRALDALERKTPSPFTNHVFQADIEYACVERFMTPSRARLLFIPRVLDVLDNVAEDREKMKRTASKIGRLLRFLNVLIIHPCPEGNEKAVFRDTALYSLQLVTKHMQQGLTESGAGGKVEAGRIGLIDFHNHLYTAAFIQRRL
jgi:hypothetical protein